MTNDFEEEFEDSEEDAEFSPLEELFFSWISEFSEEYSGTYEGEELSDDMKELMYLAYMKATFDLSNGMIHHGIPPLENLMLDSAQCLGYEMEDDDEAEEIEETEEDQIIEVPRPQSRH